MHNKTSKDEFQSKQTNLQLIVGYISIALSIFLIYITILDYFDNRKFDTQGVTTTGIITDKYIEQGVFSKEYYIDYVYRYTSGGDEGQLTKKGLLVTSDYFNKLTIDSQIIVIYLDQNPSQVVIEKLKPSLLSLFKVRLIAGLLIVGFGFRLWGAQKRKQDSSLTKHRVDQLSLSEAFEFSSDDLETNKYQRISDQQKERLQNTITIRKTDFNIILGKALIYYALMMSLMLWMISKSVLFGIFFVPPLIMFTLLIFIVYRRQKIYKENLLNGDVLILHDLRKDQFEYIQRSESYQLTTYNHTVTINSLQFNSLEGDRQYILYCWKSKDRRIPPNVLSIESTP